VKSTVTSLVEDEDKVTTKFKNPSSSLTITSEIEIDPDSYKNTPDLYNLYRAAMAMDEGHSKDLQIITVVDVALRKGDFKIAISAASEIDSDHTKSITLTDISQKALNMAEQSGYAIIAAELIPFSHSKSLAISKIVDFYENRAKGGIPGQLSNIEKYKIVYRFADSSANMDMSETDAKVFADSWFLNRSYEDFLFFKDVFTFADSRAHMNMDEKNAVKFALKWIDNYSMEEFYIFKDAFIFANSSAGMSLEEKEAEFFAFNKVHESSEKQSKLTNQVSGAP